jgi:serpin B
MIFRINICFGSLIAVLAGGLVMAQAPAKLSPDTAQVVQGNNGFGFDLFQEIRSKDGNLFYSPYSISNALAMTAAGARGNTAKEMAATLHLPPDGQRLHAGFADLIQSLNNPAKARKYDLQIANRLWGQKRFGFLPDFLKLSSDAYGAGLEELDFSAAPEAARQAINAWVEKQTKDKIKNLMPEGSVTVATRLVLTNAIYFKAQWADPFFDKATAKQDFKAGPGKTMKVDMMHKTEIMQYAATDEIQFVELPYEQHQLSMLVLLPKNADGLPALEKQLSAAKLAEWSKAAKRNNVVLSLPRFKFTSTFENLKNVLAKMGMTTAFTPQADFSGMASGAKLFIDQVVHKAFVDVNEFGTEAAAATAVGMRLAAAPVENITFTADHPFVFVIRDNATGSVLFVGRVANPE